MDLQDIGNAIESTLCEFYVKGKGEFKDESAMRLLEAAFDKYHFKDAELPIENSTLAGPFEKFTGIVEKDLSNVSMERIVKVMAAVYRSIQRRTLGGTQYLDFIRDYVGFRVGPGTRVLNNPFS
jgi:hypothetical protein